LETFPAEHRAPLRWSERNRGLFTALRACRLCFCPRLRGPASPASLRSFSLARLAALRFVLEPLVGEKHLLAGSEYELGATLRTLQDLIVIFHGWLRSPPHQGLQLAIPGEIPQRRAAQTSTSRATPACPIPQTARNLMNLPNGPDQSCSRRCFFRSRLRESACFTRRFSPGFI
jgi:hypothetical protein